MDSQADGWRTGFFYLIVNVSACVWAGVCACVFVF